jgi:hypothetical protein
MTVLQQAVKDGIYKLPADQSEASVADKLSLEFEHALYISHSSADGTLQSSYRDQMVSVNANLKRNTELRDQVLQGIVSMNALSTMTTDQMAGTKLTQQMEVMKKEAEKQHILVQEEGPRIRRTHKGEELVENDQDMVNLETTFTNRPIRRRESAVEGDFHAGSPTELHESPTTVELPESFSPKSEVKASSPVESKTLRIDTQSSPKIGTHERKPSTPFKIDDVWSSIKKPERPPSFSTAPSRQVSGISMVNEGPGDDPDIDQLLQKTEDESPPYSPTVEDSDPSFVWTGKVIMGNVAEFSASARHIGGADLSKKIPWDELLPEELVVEGRIQIARANEYLCSLRWSSTTDVVIVSLSPASYHVAEEQFTTMWSYFNDRERYGVLKKSHLPGLRDMYLIPIGAGAIPLPEFMDILEDNNIPADRPDRMLLLVSIIRANTQPSAQGTPITADSSRFAQGSPSTSNDLPTSYTDDTRRASGAGIAPSNSLSMLPLGPPGNESFVTLAQRPTHSASHETPVPAPAPGQFSNGSSPDSVGRILGPYLSTPALQQIAAQDFDLRTLTEAQLCRFREVLETVPGAKSSHEILVKNLGPPR